MRAFVSALVIGFGVTHQADAADPWRPVKTRANAPLPASEISMRGSSARFDVPAKFISGPAPAYPKTDLRLHAKGYAVIHFTVDESGRTRDFEVAKTTNQSFANDAITALQRWRFQPATKNGHPVRCRIRVPFHYPTL
jgi:protein TonB